MQMTSFYVILCRTVEMKRIPAEVQSKIKKYLQDGLSDRQTAKKVGVSASTVHRTALKLFPGRKTVKKGRPPKLTSREKAFCVRKITMDGKENASQVQKCLKNELDIDVHPRTVRRALKASGLHAIIKPKKPLLRHKNVKARLEWAKAHVNWTVDDWKRVVWSDETKIDRFGSDGKMYAWKRDSEPLLTRHVQQTVKHGGGNIKLWSCISWSGVGYIVKIDGNMTKELYKSILEEDLLESIKFFEMDLRKTVFQHDNDPKHTADFVTKWLQKQKFEVMDWPSQSPDLNPIENMWALLKRRLFRNYERPPKGMAEHWERIYETWYKITKEECRKCIESMHNRCQQIIKAKGRWIKY